MRIGKKLQRKILKKQRKNTFNMEVIRLERIFSGKDHTNSLFFVDNRFMAFGLEDEARTKKVFGETRIQATKLKVGLRSEGGFHQRYKKKFNDKRSKNFKSKDWHKGMLCMYNSKDWKITSETMEFQYCLIHIGNTDDDTAGCLLVGSSMEVHKNFVGNSTKAYESIYPILRDKILESPSGYIEMVIIDRS